MPKFTLEGREYDYDGTMPVKDAMFLHEKSGVGLSQLMVQLIHVGNPGVIRAFMYLLKRRAGEAVKWDDTESWDLASFAPVNQSPAALRAERAILEDRLGLIDKILADVEEDEPSGQEESGKAADPTRSKGGTTRKRGSGAT